MPLSIKDPETEELVRKLAQQTGESLTEAVKRAAHERLEREQWRRAGASLSERLLGIGRHCAAHLEEPFHSSDHGELLFDENGLPR